MIAALIITAGKTTHRNDFKPHEEVNTIPAIQRIVMVFQRTGIERIVVVCDEYGDKTEKLTAHMNVVFLHNHRDADMLDHFKTGLSYLQDKCSAVMITHSDVSLFSIETIRALMKAEGSICIPSYNGKTGYPMLLRSEQFQVVLSYSGEGELVEAIKASGLQCNLIEVEDEGILANAKHEEGYRHLLTEHSLRESHPDIRIRIIREKPFYGPGPHQLLQLTEETNSLREACRQMGISYSKGRTIISLMEQQLGYPVIESKQGGKTGGHSVVTEKGKELMQNYTEFCAEAKQCLHELFVKYFTH